MKLTLLFEMAGPFQSKPGFYSAPFKDCRFRRVWWLWFAIAWVVGMDLYEYNRYVESGETQWRLS